jgi:alpha-1,3-fucosyltransferase
MVSNCNSQSDREDYANQLGKYVQVDVYGHCGKLSCLSKDEATCRKMVDENYKFYLSFENSVCDDYVTEKLFKVFGMTVIPIVLGGANYSSVAPHKSYIDVNDFGSVEKLAEYLKYLDSNTTAFAEYFEWKRYFNVTDNYKKTIFCDVCKALHENSEHKIYDNLGQWWQKDAHCKTKGNFPWSKNHKVGSSQGNTIYNLATTKLAIYLPWLFLTVSLLKSISIL